jgi:ribonucleoside-triphosphate reductase (thioredoxin)
MVLAKTGNWFDVNPQRGRSNNSAVLLRDSTSWSTFSNIMESTKQCGEPGFVWADSTEIMYNPCVEIGLYPAITQTDLARAMADERSKRGISDLLSHGPISQVADILEWGGIDPQELISGWAFCNLCEINAKKCVDYPTWTRAATAAAILGTFQASFTNFDYLGPVSKAIADREALLGVSMTGIMDNPKVVLRPDYQRSVAARILQVNAIIAGKIGIKPTARATCVKPAGTTSCILGTSSGIHPHHAKRYFRRAQGNELEAPLQYYALHNPKHVEDSVWSKNKTDKSVIFCVETSDEAHTKETVSALDLLGFVKLTQENWVAAGRVPERCAAPFLRHNVSNTINIKDDEWDSVAEFIYENREAFAGISLLKHEGDRDYPQAPFCQVFTPKEIITMYGDGSLMASGLIVDGLHAFDNNLWAACNCALGIGEDLSKSFDQSKPDLVLMEEIRVRGLRRDWVRRFKKFADNYCGGDSKKCSYLLKDVSNWKLWTDLNRIYQPVDWSLLFEDRDNTKDTVLDPACAGGKCEILTV